MHEVTNTDTRLCSYRVPKLSKKYGRMSASTACKIPMINAWSVVTTRCELYSSKIKFTCSPWTSYSGRICTPRTNKEHSSTNRYLISPISFPRQGLLLVIGRRIWYLWSGFQIKEGRGGRKRPLRTGFWGRSREPVVNGFWLWKNGKLGKECVLSFAVLLGLAMASFIRTRVNLMCLSTFLFNRTALKLDILIWCGRLADSFSWLLILHSCMFSVKSTSASNSLCPT